MPAGCCPLPLDPSFEISKLGRMDAPFATSISDPAISARLPSAFRQRHGGVLRQSQGPSLGEQRARQHTAQGSKTKNRAPQSPTPYTLNHRGTTEAPQRNRTGRRSNRRNDSAANLNKKNNNPICRNCGYAAFMASHSANTCAILKSPSDVRRMSATRPSDVRGTVGRRPSDVRRTSDGRLPEVRRTSDRGPTDV